MTAPLFGPGARACAITAASFLTIGVHMPFFPVWLESRGLDAPTIGLVLAVPILLRIVVTTPLVSLADGPLGARGLLVLANAGAALAYALLGFAEAAWTIALLVAVLVMTAAGCGGSSGTDSSGRLVIAVDVPLTGSPYVRIWRCRNSRPPPSWTRPRPAGSPPSCCWLPSCSSC